MYDRLAVGESTWIRTIGCDHQARVGYFNSGFAWDVIKGCTYSRYVGRGEGKVHCTSYMDGLGFAFFYGAYHGGVFNSVSHDVDDEAVCFYKILSKRTATTIAASATMYIGGGFSSYGATIAYETTYSGSTHEVRVGGYVIVWGVFKGGKLSGVFCCIASSLVGESVDAILEKGGGDIGSFKHATFVMFGNGLYFTIQARVKRYAIFSSFYGLLYGLV